MPRRWAPPAAEGFADRAYEPDGFLAMLRQPELRFLRSGGGRAPCDADGHRGRVTATDGSHFTFPVDTFCIHGDTPGAARADRGLREGLERNGVGVRALRSRVTAPDVDARLPQRPRRLFGWWRAGSPDAQRALFAAGLGWMLDAFDVMLYALVLTAVIADLGLTSADRRALGSVTLVAAAAGGVPSASSRTGTAARRR